MAMIPTVHIWLCRESDQVLLGHFAYDKSKGGGSVSWGNLVRLAPEEMRKTGLTRVLNSLAEYPNRDSSVGSDFQRMSHREFAVFMRSQIGRAHV